MLSLHCPVELCDLAAALAPEGRCDRARWMLTRHAAHNLGPSYAIRDEAGMTLAIGGFCHNSGFVREAWAEITPAAAKRLREIVRLARLTLAGQCHHDPRSVVVLARSKAGARIARLLGMKAHAASPQIYTWSARHGRHHGGANGRRQRSRADRRASRPRDAEPKNVAGGSRQAGQPGKP